MIQLTLTAVDGGTPSKTGTSLIIIKVLDINDNTPAFSKPLYKTTVFENVAIGTTIMVLNATDLDEGANSDIAYSITKRDQNKILQIFDIDPNTGVITVKGNIDFEENNALRSAHKPVIKDSLRCPRTAKSWWRCWILMTTTQR